MRLCLTTDLLLHAYYTAILLIVHAQRTDDIENYEEHNAAIGKQDKSCVRNTGSARRASLTNRAKTIFRYAAKALARNPDVS